MLVTKAGAKGLGSGRNRFIGQGHQANQASETMDGTGIGLLQVTADGGGEIVVYRSCPLTYLDPQAYRTALRLADFRQPNPWPVQAGISPRELLFAMRIPGRAFSSTSLDHACNRLQELTQAIRR